MLFGINVNDLATAALGVQVALLIGLAAGVYLARTKRLTGHCGLMSVLALILIIVTALAMVPPLLGFLKRPQGGLFVEVLVHHTLGTSVILIWVYAVLALRGTIPMVGGRLLLPMRAAATFWVVTFFLGIHLYLRLYF